MKETKKVCAEAKMAERVTEPGTAETTKPAACPHCQRDQEPECNCRIKHRESDEYRSLLNRLKRIEGQVRGIRGMVEEERYCVDILTQVMAVQSALNSFNKELLSNHIKTCVVQDIEEGNHEAVDELCTTIQKLMK